MDDLVLDTKTIRKRAGDLSQAALSDIAHVDQSSVSLWESDRNAPRRSAAAWIQQYCATNAIELAWKPPPVKPDTAKPEKRKPRRKKRGRAA